MTPVESNGRTSSTLRILLQAIYITVIFDLAVVVAGVIVHAAGPFRAAQLTRWLVTAVIVAGGAIGLRAFSKRPFSAIALAAGALVGAVIAHFGWLVISAVLSVTGHFNYLMFGALLGKAGRHGGIHLLDLLLLASVWNGGVLLGAFGGLCLTAADSSRLRRKTRKVTLWTAAVVLGSALALCGGLWYLALSRESAVNGRWARADMPIAGYLEGLPRTKQNPVADRLVASAARLGIPPRSSRSVKDREADAVAKARWEKAGRQLRLYVETQLQRPGPGCAAPGEVTAAYLRGAQGAIAELRGLMLKQTPVWSFQVQDGRVALNLDLFMQLNLMRILVADALNAHAEGRDGLALADLDAAWRLSDCLSSRPELFSQTLLVSMRNMDLAALRKLDGAPPLWQERLEDWHPRKGPVSALRAEAASWELVPRLIARHSSGGLLTGGLGTIDDRLGSAFSEPYTRLCMADAAGRLLSLIEEEQRIGGCSSPQQVDALGKRVKDSFPWWNDPGRMSFVAPNWLLIKEAALQKELTAKVLQLKAARASDHGWPKDVPGIEKSFCPQQHWNYVLLPGGGMSLTFSGEDPLKAMGSWRRSYPLEYREPPK
jgi:hypothetical protein